MKKIEAIIREEKLESVKTALEEKGIAGMTLTRVSGRGRQKGILLQWRASDYRVDFLPKIKLEIVLSDDEYKDAVDIICKAAKTGKEGDGMIFVLPVETAFRVRTSDNGEICSKTIEGGK
ncbi:MAG: transcriptional regulator [Chloroflexi bacterium CG08_land_8_20_14_0_20_45_12]|nr:MAG: transcriptional regulator [Dehalococcoidia bacterium CG2_30_46_9]PIU22676.1 MAG: transcriptional regulator [Chloroflexi bacterium CG08_land_8_20_14_0_20_45_12]PIX27712.1 MAG: transcriptional regulator [Chloroflexi bacterium CG_4_8_14_3_um_filter_45_15]